MHLNYGKPKGTMAPEPLVTPPMTDPEPVPHCDVCGALAEQRSSARRAHDMSRVSDLNIEIRRHPHEGR
ncbi:MULTISPECIES: hypothetical protein [Streptomyces]|uniref:hypothetical protein n=1 Tax=Streptomyces TaxID=1883 RepID=UPI000ABDF4CB|nr:hypothetical protein [Streptomyces sp. SID7805]MYU52157.1 hypothetical protein [Streptomyces sp. SID7805]